MLKKIIRKLFSFLFFSTGLFPIFPILIGIFILIAYAFEWKLYLKGIPKEPSPYDWSLFHRFGGSIYNHLAKEEHE